MIIPAAQWSDAKLESFLRCLTEMDAVIASGKKLTRKLILEISARNQERGQ